MKMAASSPKFFWGGQLQKGERDFPGGPVVKNAGDMGLIPCRGTKIPHGVAHLSLRATTAEPVCHNWSICALQQKIPYDTVKIPCAATKMQQDQINNFFFFKEKTVLCF